MFHLTSAAIVLLSLGTLDFSLAAPAAPATSSSATAALKPKPKQPMADTSKVSRTHQGSVAYAPAEVHHCTVPGTVALTFAGAPYTYTNTILDILDEFKAKATFFIYGSGNAQWNGEVKQIEQRGHQLGAHAWTPGRNLSTLQTNDIKTEMYKLESTFVGAVGKFPTYFRPPYDSCTGACPQALATLGYHITYADADTHDTKSTLLNAKYAFLAGIQNRESFQTNAMAPLDKFIVAQHDAGEAMANNLTRYELQTLKERNYKVVTLGECLGDAQTGWYRTV